MSWTTLDIDGRRQRAAVARTREGVWISWEGRTTFIAAEERRASSRSEAVHDEIRAPMTGKVIQVRVAAGEEVESGAVLVVLEAMKMEYRLTAPRAGRVEAIHCQEGELVDLGKTLVTLFEPPAAAANAEPAIPETASRAG